MEVSRLSLSNHHQVLASQTHLYSRNSFTRGSAQHQSRLHTHQVVKRTDYIPATPAGSSMEDLKRASHTATIGNTLTATLVNMPRTSASHRHQNPQLPPPHHGRPTTPWQAKPATLRACQNRSTSSGCHPIGNPQTSHPPGPSTTRAAEDSAGAAICIIETFYKQRA